MSFAVYFAFLLVIVQHSRAMHETAGRKLIFPPTSPTRAQFIAGVGIPVEDLHYESVTSGYVLKAEYFLPTTAAEWHYPVRPQTIHRRSMNDTQPGQMYRWILYKGVETILDRAGLPGHICILRSICEHAAAPFHYQSGLLAETLNIILTPSSSVDPLTNDYQKDYFRAEQVGRHRGDAGCSLRYSKCEKTPMHLFSLVFDGFNKHSRAI